VVVNQNVTKQIMLLVKNNAARTMHINSTMYYILKDHLGSAYATTDASGNIVGEMRYYATGEMRLSTGSMFTDKLFAGQREMRRPELVG
jgi:uncharacterized protein RhaS with RHS repeats